MTEEKKSAPAKDIAEKIEEKMNTAEIKPGMTIRVHQKIKEMTPKGEEKERVQVFEGIVLARKHGRQKGGTITVRKIASGGIGVEKIFPLDMPSIEKIVPLKQARAKQSKLYYLRSYKKKLKETVIKE